MGIQIVKKPRGQDIDSSHDQERRDFAPRIVDTLDRSQELSVIRTLAIDRTSRIYCDDSITTCHVNAIFRLIKIPDIMRIYIMLFH